MRSRESDSPLAHRGTICYMNAHIIKVTFEAAVHKNDARFTVPAKVARLLKLKRADEIALVIRNRAGRLLYLGKQKMESRWEVYGNEMRNHIKKGGIIIVEAFCP